MSNNSYDSAGLGERIKALRMEVCGPRGRAEFARLIGLSPSTFHYYEKGRVPPVPVLVRISRQAGVSIQWLLTGYGPKYASGATNGTGTAVPPDLLRRISDLLARSPHLQRALGAFIELLEQTGDWTVAGPAGAGSLGPHPAVRRQPAWIPVIGHTAAGPAHFWEDYKPDIEIDEFDRRIDQWVLGTRPEATRTGLTADAADRSGSASGTPAHAVSLVQLAAPDDRGIVEFVDGADVAAKHPRAVAWRIDGDSMSPRYNDGDLVICCPRSHAVDGQPAVVKLHGQIGITCKVYRSSAKGLRLCAVNDKYGPIEVQRDQVRWALRVLFRVRPMG